ncbi:MAG: DUF3084 domain-containing protein [Bacillota bacterium]
MPVGIQVILMLILVGGSIAYLGDWMGSKIGKKRLSLFGLRPRYTSIVMTVITGIMIAVSTLIILSLVSSDVRQGLFHLEELKKKERQAKILTIAIHNKESAYQVLSSEYVRVQTQLQEVEQSYRAYQEKLAPLMEKYQKANEEYDRISAEMEKTQVVLNDTKAELNKVKKEKDFLNKQRLRHQSILNDLYDKINTLMKRKEELQKDVYRMTQDEIVYEAGEIFYLVKVRCKLTVDQEKDLIFTALRQAGNMAVMRGVKGINIINPDYVDAIAAQMMHSRTEKGVLALASKENTLKGMDLNLAIIFMPDEVIFRKGQILMEMLIDSSRPDYEIKEQLQSMLIFVRESAFSKGMVPDEYNELGELTDRQMINQIVQALRAKKQSYIVQVLASEDAWRTKAPAKIRFQWKPYKKSIFPFKPF